MYKSQFDTTFTGTSNNGKTYHYTMTPKPPRLYIKRDAHGQFKRHLTSVQWKSIGIALVAMLVMFWAGFTIGRFI